MTATSNFSRKKGSTNNCSFQIGTAPYQLVDCLTDHEYIRKLVIQEQLIRRTILKLYIRLPWNLQIDFLGKTDSFQTEVKDALSNLDSDSESAIRSVIDKKNTSFIDELDNDPCKSVFRFHITNRERLIKCMDEDGAIDEAVNSSTNPFLYYTQKLEYQLPGRVHEIKIDITMDRTVEKDLRKNQKEFLRDLIQLMRF